MTPKISLITAIVGAALVFALPAYADNWGSERQDQAVRVSPDIVDLLVAKNGTVDGAVVDAVNQSNMLDARERALGVAKTTPQPQGFDARSDGLNRLYGLGEYSNMLDARERALGVAKTTPQPQGYDARSDGLNRQYGLGEYASPVVADFDRFRIDHSNDPVTVSATSSGRDFEWPTIGIGFGIGIVLILGLALAMKATHTRPFAH
jgi:hypothetical protein